VKSGGVELTRGEMLALHGPRRVLRQAPVADAVARVRQELEQTIAHSRG